MGGRYYLTGVQLGMLMASIDEEEKMKTLQEIMDNQFIDNFEAEDWKKKLMLLTGVKK